MIHLLDAFGSVWMACIPDEHSMEDVEQSSATCSVDQRVSIGLIPRHIFTEAVSAALCFLKDGHQQAKGASAERRTFLLLLPRRLLPNSFGDTVLLLSCSFKGLAGDKRNRIALLCHHGLKVRIGIHL